MTTLLGPAILFFCFGLLAGALRSNLEIPPQIARFLSLYLLMALGLKGGFALAASGLTREVATTLAAALLLAVVVPLGGFRLLRRFLNGFDAAALAATYGSVSAVTFITAVQVLEQRDIAFGGHMAAAMALMESPAIIIAIYLANALRKEATATAALRVGGDGSVALAGPPAPSPIGKILHESFTDGAQLLLLGAMLIGIVTGEAGAETMKPFTQDLFKGMLALFLLDMGLSAARNMPRPRDVPASLALYAVLGPLVHATLALGLSVVFGVSAGNAALLMVLAASASYIAVPAVVRYAIPEARPALYVGMSLGVTFPLNILLGIPLYIAVSQAVLGAA